MTKNKTNILNYTLENKNQTKQLAKNKVTKGYFHRISWFILVYIYNF